MAISTFYIYHNAAFPVVADPWIQWLWNGFSFHLTRSDEAFIATGGVEALSVLLAIPGVGWAAFAGLLWTVPYAGWAYLNHECASITIVFGQNAGVSWNRC